MSEREETDSGLSPFKDAPRLFRTVTSPLFWIAFYIASRLVMAYLWIHHTPHVSYDVYYYHWYLERADPSLAATLIEYPTPVVWILLAMFNIASTKLGFSIVFSTTMIALDVALAITLWRKRPISGMYWIVFGTASGSIMWFRFDLIPTAFVAWGLLFAFNHPKVSGALIAAGAAVKLWPALLMSAFANNWSASAKRRFLGFGVAGIGLALASLVTSGWMRTSSPLTWQSERGLQIESVIATPLLIWRTFTTSNLWNIALSKHNAWEITGPGQPELLVVANIATIAAIACCGWVAWRLSLSELTFERAALGVLVVLNVLIVSNKTFSTQYMLWVGPVVALTLANLATSRQSSNLVMLAGVYLLVSVATQFVYPWAYGAILANPMTDVFPSSVLIVRNLAMLWLTWRCASSLRQATSQVSASI